MRGGTVLERLRMTRKQWVGVGLAVVAALVLYLVFEGDPVKAGGLFLAGALLDIGLDYLMTKVEKARGDI